MKPFESTSSKILFLLGLSTILFLSKVYSQQLLFGKQEMKTGYTPIKQTLNYDEIKGSPYFDEKLLNGIVKFNSGDSVLTYLRYNIYTDKMEYLVSNTLLELKNENDVDFLIVSGEKFVFKKFNNANVEEKGYLREVVSGKYTLYIRYRVKFQKGEAARSSYHEPVPPKFVKMPELWLVSKDQGAIEKSSFSSTELESLFGNHLDEVEAYRKKNKLKFSRDADVTQIFKYANTL